MGQFTGRRARGGCRQDGWGLGHSLFSLESLTCVPKQSLMCFLGEIIRRPSGKLAWPRGPGNLVISWDYVINEASRMFLGQF